MKGPPDIVLQNLSELKKYLETSKFTRAHISALMAGLFCPPAHLTAIFTAVAKKLNRLIISTSKEKLTWSTAVDKKFHPWITKVVHLYFLNQSITIPRCCIALAPMDQTDYWVVGFTDESLDYSAACIYIISASKTNSNCKAQLVTTATKIAIHNISDEISVPLQRNFCLLARS